MIEPVGVCEILKEYSDVEDFKEDELLISCRLGLDWVKRRLKDDADEDDPLIGKTAAAMARFYLFVRRLGDTERLKSYKVGDMTVQRDISKEYEFEDRLLRQALAEAFEILKDGGFYFAVG